MCAGQVPWHGATQSPTWSPRRSSRAVVRAARQRVEIARQRGDQRLAFAGLHLRDLPLVKNDPAHELDVELPETDGSLGGFANDRVDLDQESVKRFPFGEAFFELGGFCAQVGIGQRCDRGFQGVDLRHDRMELLERPLVLRPENLF